MRKVNLLLFASLSLLAVMLLGIVSSAGVGSLYTKDNPLKMTYGQTKTIDLLLTNKGVSEGKTFEIEIKQGSDILSIEKTSYFVNAESELNVPLTFFVPEDYGKPSQAIELSVKSGTPDQGGMVTLGTAWTTTFNVELSVAEEMPEGSDAEGGILIYVLIIAIIILTLIVLFVMKRKK